MGKLPKIGSITMTFVETILLIQERKEIVYLDTTGLLRTNKHLYLRDRECCWIEKELPQDDKFVVPQKPLIFPVKTK
jgi:hypothetical protein